MTGTGSYNHAVASAKRCRDLAKMVHGNVRALRLTTSTGRPALDAPARDELVAMYRRLDGIASDLAVMSRQSMELADRVISRHGSRGSYHLQASGR